MSVMVILVPTAVAAGPWHECLAEYAVSQHWRSVTVTAQSPRMLHGGRCI